jgi:hypothetical protein
VVIFEYFIQRRQLKEEFPMRYDRIEIIAWFSLPRVIDAKNCAFSLSDSSYNDMKKGPSALLIGLRKINDAFERKPRVFS